MNGLNWILMGLMSLAVLCFFLGLVAMFKIVASQKKLAEMGKSKPSREQELAWKKWSSKWGAISRQQNYIWFLFFSGLISSFLLMGSTFYSYHNQVDKLDKQDASTLARGAALLWELEKQMEQVQTNDNQQKMQETLYNLTARLNNEGTKKADQHLSKEGQKLLNGFYINLKELGVNIGKESLESLGETVVYEEYVADIEAAKTNQQAVFSYFYIAVE